MAKLITVSGRTLSLSDKSHSSLDYEITETDTQASRTRGNSQNVIINRIDLSCSCSGDYVSGVSTFVGLGSAAIVGHTNMVKCEGESILLDGDNVEITCNGTITNTSSGATSLGTATVTVTITDTNQPDIFASET